MVASDGDRPATGHVVGSTGQATSRWLPPSQNAWGVPVLHIADLTARVLSFSSNAQQARNAISFAGDDGLSWAGVAPRSARVVPLGLRFRVDRMLAEGALFVPRAMEQKWALFFQRGDVIVVRSWDREVYLRARTSCDGDHVTLIDAVGFITAPDESAEFTRSALEFLIRSYVLEEATPAPLPGGRAALQIDLAKIEQSVLWHYGNRVRFVIADPLILEPSTATLRTDSLFHIAIAREDLGAAQRQLDAGVPIDILAADGRSIMCWSLQPGVEALEWLVDRGLDVDTPSVRGETALMVMTEHRLTDKAIWLLDHGANPNAADHRGFTSLHRAAEVGVLPIVESLLAHGADPTTQAGVHTPRALAEMRGHGHIVEALRGL